MNRLVEQSIQDLKSQLHKFYQWFGPTSELNYKVIEQTLERKLFQLWEAAIDIREELRND